MGKVEKMHQATPVQSDMRPMDLFDAADCIVLQVDPRGMVLGMNRYAKKWFRLPESSIIGNAMIGTLIPELSSAGDNQRILIEDAMSHPTRATCIECEVYAPEGAVAKVAWSMDIQFGADGGVESFYFIGICRQEVLERKQAVQARYDVLESFMQASKAFAFELDSEHHFSYVGPGIRNILGYAPEEVIGRHPEILLDTKEAADTKSRMERAHQEPVVVFQTRQINRHKDGHAVAVEVISTLVNDDRGRFREAYGLVRDISEQKKTEEELADRENEYRYLFDHAQVSLTVTDENGVIRNINQAGAQIFGRKPEELVGHEFTEFVPGFEREKVFSTFQQDYRRAMAKEGSNVVGMSGNVNKISTPGGLRDLLFHKTGVKVYRGDQCLGILNTAVDITETVAAREKLKEHQEQLERLVAERTSELESLQETMSRQERLVALGKLADIVSHEIRNPLGTLSSSLYIIHERLKDLDLGVARSIDRAERAIMRCDAIMEEFRDYTRLKELQKRKTDLDAWLNTLLDELSNGKGARQVRRLLSGAAVDIDPERFRRVMINILDNAGHSMQDAKEGTITIVSKKVFNRIEIIVSDTGTGIPRENLERIFEPLYSTKAFGVGLGLPICRQIVDQHGGGISIESEEGKGTAVFIWLPAYRDDVALPNGHRPDF